MGIAVIPSSASAAEISSNLAASCQVRHLVNITHFALAFPLPPMMSLCVSARAEDRRFQIIFVLLCAGALALVQSWLAAQSLETEQQG